MINKNLRAFFIGAPTVLVVVIFMVRDIISTNVSYVPNIVIILLVAGIIPIISLVAKKILKKEIVHDAYNFFITGSLFFTLVMVLVSENSNGPRGASIDPLSTPLVAGLFFIAAFGSLTVSLLSVIFPTLNRDIF